MKLWMQHEGEPAHVVPKDAYQVVREAGTLTVTFYEPLTAPGSIWFEFTDEDEVDPTLPAVTAAFPLPAPPLMVFTAEGAVEEAERILRRN